MIGTGINIQDLRLTSSIKGIPASTQRTAVHTEPWKAIMGHQESAYKLSGVRFVPEVGVVPHRFKVRISGSRPDV